MPSCCSVEAIKNTKLCKLYKGTKGFTNADPAWACHTYPSNFQLGSRNHNTGIPANRTVSVIMLSQIKLIFVAFNQGTEISAKRDSPAHVIRPLVLLPDFTPSPFTSMIFQSPSSPHTQNCSPPNYLHTPFSSKLN